MIATFYNVEESPDSIKQGVQHKLEAVRPS